LVFITQMYRDTRSTKHFKKTFLRSTNIREIFVNYKNKNNYDDDDDDNNNNNNDDDDMVPALNKMNMKSSISGELWCFVNHVTVIYTYL